MVDIATVSVITSAALAGGTILANFVGGERQRGHEADLDFERRVWERKSEALFSLMEECRFLADSDLPITDNNREGYALDLSKSLDRLHNVRSAIDAFASTRTRTELNGLMEAMLAGGVKHHAGNEAKRYFNLALNTGIDEIKTRRMWREYEDKARARAVENFEPDIDSIRERAGRLLEAARESVRSPKD